MRGGDTLIFGLTQGAAENPESISPHSPLRMRIISQTSIMPPLLTFPLNPKGPNVVASLPRRVALFRDNLVALF